MSAKYFSLVLHSRIPYVPAPGSWPRGTDWLYEAAAEGYLPLLLVFERLCEEGHPARINISFTPVLVEQLKSPSFAAKLKEYLKMKVTISPSDRAYFERTGNKRPYDPERVRERLKENAGHFVDSLCESLKDQANGGGVALCDTELFGHWWSAGSEWLYVVLKRLHQTGIEPQKESRILRQISREKFLLENSDWPFLISTWTARDYPENRAAEHYERASTLAQWIHRDSPLSPAETRLPKTWEEEDSLFPEVVVPDGRII